MNKFLVISCTLILVSSEVVVLTDDNSHIIQDGEWFIKAYAPWCGACKSIAQSWIQLGAWAEDKEYNIAEIDITVGYSLSNQLLVTRIPTLFHVKDGVFRTYQGARKVDVWKKFLEEGECDSLEPMSWYRRPGSVTMQMFGYLVSFAIKVNDMHDYLTKEANVPVVASIIILIAIPIVAMIALFLVTVWGIHSVFGKPKQAHTIGLQRSQPRPVSQEEDEEDKKVQ